VQNAVISFSRLFFATEKVLQDQLGVMAAVGALVLLVQIIFKDE
jgi:hypothetical protein